MEILTATIFFSLTVTATIIIFMARYLWSQNSKLPPSPSWCLPIIGHLHLRKKHHLPQALQHLSSIHGPVLFLKFGCRPVLVLSSPESIEECFTNHDQTLANRPRTITSDHFGYGYKNFGLAPYGDIWRTLRRISTLEVFSSTALQKSSFIRNEEVLNLCSRLFRSSMDSAQKVDLNYHFILLTAQAMLRLVSGTRGGVEESDEKNFLDDFKLRFFASIAMNVCDFLPVLRWIGYKGIEKRVMEIQRMRDEYLQRIIDDVRVRMMENNSTDCVLEKFLRLQETEPEFYSDDVIKGLVVLLFNGGTDTSPAVMEWAMSVLLNHPDKLEKLREEIRCNVKHEGRIIQDSDLSSLPYLRCVIYETLRLYPLAPLLLPHCSSKKFKLGNYEIPENTMLFVNVWAVHRDGELWEDADVFKPERFEGFVGERDGFRFLPFGLGRRACPGTALGMRTVALAVGALVQCFEWKKVDEGDIDMTPVFGVSMTKAEPLLALPKPWPHMVPILSQL
ncbi:unnamed protein product [Eruca vesicaria subsp. sativa]|uniref:Cytochrome P450 n=1 Tax=Eruca vesicaria subsp. sativa TaxID=29727 RepID=A0ABC8IR46_ERUVS|nr:unnamed protein product [Eruca vesicaria subsp. sativa]